MPLYTPSLSYTHTYTHTLIHSQSLIHTLSSHIKQIKLNLHILQQLPPPYSLYLSLKHSFKHTVFPYKLPKHQNLHILQLPSLSLSPHPHTHSHTHLPPPLCYTLIPASHIGVGDDEPGYYEVEKEDWVHCQSFAGAGLAVSQEHHGSWKEVDMVLELGDVLAMSVLVLI